jgi:hypothetical protein
MVQRKQSSWSKENIILGQIVQRKKMDAQSINMVRIQNKLKSIAKSTGPDEIRSSWFKENV